MEEITTIINEYDLDGDGHIDFSEYKQIYMAYMFKYSEGDLYQHKKKY